MPGTGAGDSPQPLQVQPGSDDEELERILQGLKVNIKIIGCGGAGSNTIDRLVESGITGVEYVAANTDAQHLLTIHCDRKILMGKRITRGLGAGALPRVGEQAAQEAEEQIRAALAGAHIVFLTCGLGGGTGTGSVHVIGKIARDMGALTIATVTLPFRAEGAVRMENAEWGLEMLRSAVDTVIVVPNDKLIKLVPRLNLKAAFRVADEILMRSIKGITDIVTRPGLVNLDFNDLKTILKGGGVSMIGIGEASEDNRAEEAVNEAIHSPLLEVDISSASGALVNVTGGPDMTVTEAEKVVEGISSQINQNARIIWGAAVDPALEHTLRVLIVLTGVRSKQILGPSVAFRPETAGVDMVR